MGGTWESLCIIGLCVSAFAPLLDAAAQSGAASRKGILQFLWDLKPQLLRAEDLQVPCWVAGLPLSPGQLSFAFHQCVQFDWMSVWHVLVIAFVYRPHQCSALAVKM